MSTQQKSQVNAKKSASPAVNLVAGGGAGMMEALVCHPLGMNHLGTSIELK